MHVGDDPLTHLLPRLTQLSDVLNRGRVYERAVEAAGVTLERPAMSVLAVLHAADRPLRVGEIAARQQVVGPHVTRQVNVLERRGFVRRVTDPADQRARLIEPTPEGAAAVGRYLQTVLGWFTDALSGWSERDREELGRLLGRFVDDLSARVSAFDEESG
jgi:DNA-binding MarR family transcriptional regulator